jgi:hypothetical protein
MGNSNFMQVKAAIYEMGLLFNQQPSEDRINAYARALQNYSTKQITFAFKQVINSGSAFFPSLAEILKHLKVNEPKKEDRAPLITQEILRAIRSYGQYAEKEMLESVSEDARGVLLVIGNTGHIRNSENYETTFAQLERTVKSYLSSKEFSNKQETLNQVNERINATAVNFSGYLEEMKK